MNTLKIASCLIALGAAVAIESAAAQGRAIDSRRAQDRPEEVIRFGMSRQQVLDVFGRPWSSESAGDEMYLYFANYICAGSCQPDLVVLRSDRVVAATLRTPWRRIEGSTATAPPSGPRSPAPLAAPTIPADAVGSELVPLLGTEIALGSVSPDTMVASTAPEVATSTGASAAKDVSPPAPGRGRLITAHTSVTSLVDTNLYRREDEFLARGAVMAAGVRFQSRSSRPGLQIAYEAALHTYPDAEEWSRASHQVQAILARRLSDRIAVQITGEAALKGTSEDRDLGDLFTVSPRLELRMSRVTRFRLTGAYRERHLAAGGVPDETNGYGELELRQDLDGRRWEVFYRYERNRSESARNLYSRWTFGTAHTSRIDGVGELGLDIRYRSQTYINRFVEIESDDVRRQDHRWIAGATWTRELGFGFSTLLEYRFETRASNDPGKHYDAHTLTGGFRFDL